MSRDTVQLPPAPVGNAVLAVATWKHEELVEAQGAVLRAGLAEEYVSPGDVPEEVAEGHRQGVMSNAWNALRAVGLVQRLPMSFTLASRGIVGGRVRNSNPKAKGRWTACYYLPSRRLAEAWLLRHGFAVRDSGAPTQLELLKNDTL